MKVHQLMSRDVVSCPRTSTLVEPAKAMWDNDVGFVPIVDSDSGVLLGVVTDRDICMAAMTKGKPLHAIPVEEVMRNDVYACSESDSVARVHSIMRGHKLHRVPVIDDKKRVVGVIAINDLARHANTTASKGMRDAFIKTIGAVCEPHLLPGKTSKTREPHLELVEAW